MSALKSRHAPFIKRADSRLSDPELVSRLTLSPASLLNVLPQCCHQISPHLEHASLSFVESEIVEHATTWRSDMARPVVIVSTLLHRSFSRRLRNGLESRFGQCIDVPDVTSNVWATHAQTELRGRQPALFEPMWQIQQKADDASPGMK
jgi:hypothetical protein